MNQDEPMEQVPADVAAEIDREPDAMEVEIDPNAAAPADDANAVVLQLQQEKAELQDSLMRLQAEFINFRRQQEQRLQQDRKFATERLVAELVPVLDNFDRTVRHLQNGATVEAMMDGVNAVSKQLFSVLQAQGVSKIASVGEHFNPEMHEAIAVDETTDAEDGVILEEIEAGYRIAERIVRPARVRVAKR